MTKINLYIMLLFLCVGLQHTFGQNYKFKTSGVSVLEKNERGKGAKWSDLQLVNIVVSLDTQKSRIVIFSEVVQLFEIIEYQATEENDTDVIYSFVCKDNNGDDCTISIITRKQQDNRKQLYINYGNRIILYNIFNL
jgi:hypothetical protein